VGNPVPARLTPSEGRRFAFPVGVAFLLLAGLLGWRSHAVAAGVLAGVGGTLLVAGVLIPGHLGPVQRGWMAFALALSKVTTPVFMGITFFLVITPTGFLVRRFGRNPVTRTPHEGSFWVRRPEGAGRRSNLERQF
jgi:hypothetical protein